MTGWDVHPANTRVQLEWRRLRRKYPEPTLTALRYWMDDPFAPHELVVRPRGALAVRRWGAGSDKKSYEQRGFIVADTTAFFIVVDDIAAIVITALMAFLTNLDV